MFLQLQKGKEGENDLDAKTVGGAKRVRTHKYRRLPVDARLTANASGGWRSGKP